MKNLTALLAFALSCGAADLPLGKPLTLKSPMTVAKLMERPDAFVGGIVQVKGRVTEVCQRMGCWMNLVDPGGEKAVRIKVADAEIVFPKDSIGKMAVAEGKLVKLELTREQAVTRARHEAKEMGRSFDPNTIKKGVIIYQIQGTGAVLLGQ
ncbi:MAG: DUF4920 domain-containing protein [Bryobacteraceae bacterium]|nr:DUF4920 domain-containing protein [Bryobacteraceae bacterium]